MNPYPFSPKATGPRSCIFCGGTPVTREHVWPQWLARELGPASKLHRDRGGSAKMAVRAGVVETPGGGVNVVNWIEDKAGPATAAKQVLKVACGPCNSGWMASLEAAAKPIVLELMSNRRAKLASETDREVLVRWLLKCAAVWEWDDPASAILPPEHRAEIADFDTPVSAEWLVEMVWCPHDFGNAHVAEMFSDGPDLHPIGSTFLHLLAIGNAGFVVRRASNPEVTLPDRHFGRRAVRIWPEHDRGRVRRRVGERRWYRGVRTRAKLAEPPAAGEI